MHGAKIKTINNKIQFLKTHITQNWVYFLCSLCTPCTLYGSVCHKETQTIPVTHTLLNLHNYCKSTSTTNAFKYQLSDVPNEFFHADGRTDGRTEGPDEPNSRLL